MNIKMKSILALVALAACNVILMTGCVTATPQTSTIPVVASNPATGLAVTNLVTVTNQVYSASPALAATQAKIDAGIQSFSPLVSTALPVASPAVAVAQPLVDGVFGLIALASGLLAAYKNKQANSHSNAAAALAATVVANGQQAAALVNAASNGSAGVVAQHLADAANPVQL